MEEHGGVWGWDLLVFHDVERPVERPLADLSWIQAGFDERIDDSGSGRLNLSYFTCLEGSGTLNLLYFHVWKGSGGL